VTPVHRLRGWLDAQLRALAYWLGARPAPGSMWHDYVRAEQLAVTERRRVGTHTVINRDLIVGSTSVDQLLALAVADSQRRLRDWCWLHAYSLLDQLDATVQDDAYTFVRNQVGLLVEGWAHPEPWQWWRSRRRRLGRWWGARPLHRAWRSYWQLVRVQPQPEPEEEVPW
jgi:hypothetical protein